MLTLFLMGVVVSGGLYAIAHILSRFLPSDDKEFILQQRSNYINRKAAIDSDLSKADRGFVQAQVNARTIRKRPLHFRLPF